jgi:ATP-dependent Clp protease ATP-binding subunit ClpX
VRQPNVCNFCGVSDLIAEFMLAGASAFICDRCVESGLGVIADARRTPRSAQSLVDPVDLVAHLDRWVVGQDRVKRMLAVAAANHYKRMSLSGRRLGKSNVLLAGPTGSGKTLLAKALADYLDVPLLVTDVTGLTQAGYAGDDVEMILSALVRLAGGDVARAERGIVFLDEIDKLARRSPGAAGRSLDVSGEGVQQSLLKIVEGTAVRLPERGQSSPPVEVSTENILFIAGGAFAELAEISQDRRRHGTLGFGRDLGTPEAGDPEFDDLVEFGMLPEFLGRFPVFGRLSALTAEQLRLVLLDAEHAVIPEFRRLLACDQIGLRFTDDAVSRIACDAAGRGSGARGLRGIVENLLTDVMYHASRLPDRTRLTVTEDDVVLGRVAQLDSLPRETAAGSTGAEARVRAARRARA